MALISMNNINKDYTLGKTTIHAIKGVSFEIDRGEFLSVVGPSGCGKTTLLNIIGCIDKPTEGTVLFEGTDIATLSDNMESELRLKKIGFIFQSFNLIPVLNIFENIELPLIVGKVPKSERKKRVAYLVKAVGLEEFAAHKPDELSGGQRQRVAIARALVNKPDLVIADEPTANLDSVTGNTVLELMEKLNREEKVTFIFSTHNPEVMKYAHRIIHLKDGTISEVKSNGGRP
ncbi:MAG: ABC transporter ATP-binding protein [Spirochaetales bacterium]|nr:ABC transporter ATP-binding protein [Spirochaetales bacterium]